MHERLVESWLDSASERSYQAPFCQVLAAQGHTILHSTRHSPIELGKDVITLGPDKVPHAYQLKGNPGGRLTLLQLRELQPQLRHLTDLAILHPAVSGKQHRSYLVTNGYVDEEATLAVQQMNAGQVTAGYPDRHLDVIQRGELLAWANQLGESLWPSEVQQTHLLLEMLVEEGTGAFPALRWNSMLINLLGLDEKRPSWTAAELHRRIASAAILTAITLKNYEARDNHFAIVGAWVQYAAAVIGACERFGVSYNKNAAAAVTIAMGTIRDALIDLGQEVLSLEVMTEGEAVVDAAFYRARYTLILGLLSVLWLWCQEESWPGDLDKEELEKFLLEGESYGTLWGEGAVPQLLAHYWFLKMRRPAAATDLRLVAMLNRLSATGPDSEPDGLPDPYWDFDSVIRHELVPILGPRQDELGRYTTGRVSYFAESLLHLLVRTNLKNQCKSAWPGISRLRLAEFIPQHRWQYCLCFTPHGAVREVQPPLRKKWNDLMQEAASIHCDSPPPPLTENAPLLWLYVLLFPYRGKPDVVRRVSYRFNRTWLISQPPIE